MKINGACHCGAIAFEADIDPSRVVVCHCTDCQVLSGAPLRAIVSTPIEQFSLLRGEPKRYVKVAQSGNGGRNCSARTAARRCGAPRQRTRPRWSSAWAASSSGIS